MRSARKARGLNCDRLAHELGMTAGTIAAWDMGRRVPPIEQVCRLAAVLEVDLADLFEDAS